MDFQIDHRGGSVAELFLEYGELAQTTEIYLRFGVERVSDAEVGDLGRAVQEPLIAPADPEYACATGALEHTYHTGDARFADVDQGLDSLIDSVAVEPIERCQLYGMMRYRNMVCSHSPGPAVPAPLLSLPRSR